MRSYGRASAGGENSSLKGVAVADEQGAGLPPEPWAERISIDPEICHGKPCIKGTRIMLSIILDYLTAGDPPEEILRQYPTLARGDIAAALGYAAWLAHEEDVQPLHTGPTG